MRSLNWRRGLIRLWLVLSIIWICAVGWIMRPDKDALSYWQMHSLQQDYVEAGVEPKSERCKQEDGSLNADCIDTEWARAQKNRDNMTDAIVRKRESLEDMKFTGGIIAGPIILLLILGFVFGWVAKGFSYRDKSEN